MKAQRLLSLLRELAEEEVEVAQVDHLARILDPHNDDRLDNLESESLYGVRIFICEEWVG